MSPPRSLTMPVGEIPDDRLGEFRQNLVAEAAELVDRAGGATLDPDAAATFGTIERLVDVLDLRARTVAQQRAMESSGLVQSIFDAQQNGEPESFRPTGGLPPARFTEDQYRQFHAGLRSGNAPSIPLDTFAVTAPPMSTIPGNRLPPEPFDRESTRIASVLPTEETTAAKVNFYVATTAASAAAPVAEGAAKPESTPAWTATTVDVRKIAHYVDVSTEALDDYPAFRQVVGDEMTAGLIAAENTQLVSGSGSGVNIRGLVNTTGIGTYAPGSAEARYRSTRRAIRNLRKSTSFATADTVVLHPDDDELLDLSNDTTAGLHAVADLAAGSGSSIWGLRKVVTTGIAAGTALVMDSRRAAVLYVRQPPTLLADPYSQSVSNLVRVIVEERIALAVVNPAAIMRVTFNGTT